MSRTRLRPLNEPRRIEVRIAPADGGEDVPGEPGLFPATPVAVKLDGRLLRVEVVRERWRIDDEWWRRPLSRLYHELVLEGGQRVVLYRDLVEGGWYVQG